MPASALGTGMAWRRFNRERKPDMSTQRFQMLALCTVLVLLTAGCPTQTNDQDGNSNGNGNGNGGPGTGDPNPDPGSDPDLATLRIRVFTNGEPAVGALVYARTEFRGEILCQTNVADDGFAICRIQPSQSILLSASFTTDPNSESGYRPAFVPGYAGTFDYTLTISP